MSLYYFYDDSWMFEETERLLNNKSITSLESIRK